SAYDLKSLKDDRVQSFKLPSGDERFLMIGGPNYFLDLCPKHGCIAVEFARDGKVAHAYPYLPEEIAKAKKIVDLPYESAFFDFAKQARVHGVQRFSNGDLLVTFEFLGTFPGAGGIARISPDGNPLWVRGDYGHHWPALVDDDEIIGPSMKITASQQSIKIYKDLRFVLKCGPMGMLSETINIVNGSGKTIDQIDLLNAFINSPYRGLLYQSPNPCLPLHLNSVKRAPADMASALQGVETGDFIVSLRDINAIGIIGKDSKKFKRLFRGTWMRQHSVQPLEGSKILMFDNLGSDYDGGPSRLLQVDLATGEERTIFPRKGQPVLFSHLSGYVDISADRQRALVSFSDEGLAYEVRLSDSSILAKITSLHDLHAAPAYASDTKFQSKAALFRNYGVLYVQKPSFSANVVK
ncbi:MAG: arylsulfotransferase family protein, partial [Alphaproteobacteria bacterium]|nr:arylsulfotransferase family protein [Alphaproteobacteria bacterium]